MFHIGTKKTGSSTLQKTMLQNRKKLAEQGIVYGEIGAGKKPNHNILVRELTSEGSEVLEDFCAVVGQHQNKTFVLSSEIACHKDPKDFAALFDLFDGNVEVVVFLRRQDHLLESEYKQRVKSGRRLKLTFDQFLDNIERNDEVDEIDPGFPTDYDKLLKGWEDVFGRERIHLILFELGRDSSRDFFDWVGVEMDALDIPTRVNVGADAVGSELIMRLTPAVAEEKQYSFKKAISQRYQKKNISFIAIEQRRKLVEQFADSNAAVARRFLDRETLFDLTDLDDDTFELIDRENLLENEFIRLFQKHVNLEEKAYLQKAELLVLKGQLGKARAVLRQLFAIAPKNKRGRALLIEINKQSRKGDINERERPQTQHSFRFFRHAARRHARLLRQWRGQDPEL